MNKNKGFTLRRTLLRKNLVNVQTGFTLIELLIVIAIIAILLALSTFGFQGVFENTRNARRKSDLGQYQASLKNYANKNQGFYPKRSTAIQADTTLCTTDLGLTGCPADPSNDGTHTYYYISNGLCTNGQACATDYTLYGMLEEETTSYWVVCANGKSGVRASVPTATCPF